MAISRQQAWKLKKIEAGLCAQCGKGKIKNYARLCDKCRAKETDNEAARIGSRRRYSRRIDTLKAERRVRAGEMAIELAKEIVNASPDILIGLGFRTKAQAIIDTLGEQ